ncbi:hypothetical protein [Paenibacillus alba]|uniref:Uncharacterized protein n=1 Tax=Paenibacillus alba TaxID=1197127 RepID=A0ABU6G643_9BACL|nr:hypothetical protein [Paenibacillus alba]MEC0228702.1 hypothetical protein [Paenibacillus alba]
MQRFPENSKLSVRVIASGSSSVIPLGGEVLCSVENEYHGERRENHKPEIETMIQRLEGEALPVVDNPNLTITSEFIERAIADAKALIENTGATSAVDRVHSPPFLFWCCKQSNDYYHTVHYVF